MSTTELPLVERIKEALMTDEEDWSDEVRYWYQEASREEQRAIDRVFIALCGWGLHTLLNEGREDPGYRPFDDR
jgi:hypothetical protein